MYSYTRGQIPFGVMTNNKLLDIKKICWAKNTVQKNNIKTLETRNNYVDLSTYTLNLYQMSAWKYT